MQGILNFSTKRVTKEHLYYAGRRDNERLNEIHEKLSDPRGHMTLMDRHAAYQSKRRANLTTEPA